MSGNQTHGYDIVIEVNVQELNEQIAIMFADGRLPIEINRTSPLGEMHLIFDTPLLDFETDIPNGINFHQPFSNSTLTLAGAPAPFTGLSGEFHITDNLSIGQGDDTRYVRVDFTDGIHDVQVVLSDDTRTTLQSSGIDPDLVEEAFKNAIPTALAEDIGEIRLTPELDRFEPPLNLYDMDIAVINDPNSLNGDVLALLIRTSAATNGDPAAFNTSLIPSGQNSALIFNSDYVIGLICPQIANQLGIDPSKFDSSCGLKSAVNISAGGKTAKLTSLGLKIVNDYIRVRGKVIKSDTGWDAEGTFEIRVYLVIENGELTFKSELVSSDIDVSLEWWVWLTAIAIGAIIGGIIAGIVGAVVGAIIAAFLTAVVKAIVVESITGDMEIGPEDIALPIGPIGGDLNLQTVLLDDLLLAGSAIRIIQMPIKQSDLLTFEGFRDINLDTGFHQSIASLQYHTLYKFYPTQAAQPIFPGTNTGFDISFRAGGIQPVFGASLTAMPMTIFEQISPVDLENVQNQMSNSIIVPWNEIPEGFVTGGPVLPENYLVLVVRTNEGRYAKCAVSRMPDGRYQFRYITYDRPVPAVWIEYIFNSSVDVEEARLVTTYKAKHSLMAYPVTTQWSLGGRILDGVGIVTLEGVEFQYEVEGNRCTIKTDRKWGGLLLCATCTDSRGIKIRGCRDLGQIESYRQKYQFELLSRLTDLGYWLKEKFPDVVDPGLDPTSPDPSPLPTLLEGLKLSDLTPSALIEKGFLGNLLGFRPSMENPDIVYTWRQDFNRALEVEMKDK